MSLVLHILEQDKWPAFFADKAWIFHLDSFSFFQKLWELSKEYYTSRRLVRTANSENLQKHWRHPLYFECHIYTLVYTTHDKMPSKKYAMCLDHICGIPCRWILVFVFPCLWLPVLLWMWTKQEEGTWGQNFAPWLVLNCAFSHMPVVAFLIPHHQSQSLLTRLFSISDWIPVWSAVLLLS